jgi:hypothetical protein
VRRKIGTFDFDLTTNGDPLDDGFLDVSDRAADEKYDDFCACMRRAEEESEEEPDRTVREQDFTWKNQGGTYTFHLKLSDYCEFETLTNGV